MNLNQQDSEKVITIKARLAVLGPKLLDLQKYTRPLGKAQVSFEVAQSLENEYNKYSAEFTKLSNQLRKIYRANGMEYL